MGSKYYSKEVPVLKKRSKFTAKPGEGLTSLPSGNRVDHHNKLVWNLYRTRGTSEHYYHCSPFSENDILVKENINPENAFSLIQRYNDEAKKRFSKKKKRVLN